MPLAIASGSRNYAGTWSAPKFAAKTVANFYGDSALELVTTTEYTNDLSKGGTEAIIPLDPVVEIYDIVKGERRRIKECEPRIVTVPIDRQKGFNIFVEDVDQVQGTFDFMARAQVAGAASLKRSLEQSVFASLYGSASAYNRGATAGKLEGAYSLGVAGGSAVNFISSTTMPMQKVLECAAALDECDVPRDGKRFILLPPRAIQHLKLSPVGSAAEMGDGQSAIRKGVVGELDGFTVISTTNLYKDTGGWHCIFGHRSATAFCAQLRKVNRFNSEEYWGDVISAKTLYGFQCVVPEALGELYIAFS